MRWANEFSLIEFSFSRSSHPHLARVVRHCSSSKAKRRSGSRWKCCSFSRQLFLLFLFFPLFGTWKILRCIRRFLFILKITWEKSHRIKIESMRLKIYSRLKIFKKVSQTWLGRENFFHGLFKILHFLREVFSSNWLFWRTCALIWQPRLLRRTWKIKDMIRSWPKSK